MSNLFANGILLTEGTPNTPSLRFLNNPYSGLYLYGKNGIGLTSYGQTTFTTDYELTTINTNLRLTKNPIKNAILTSDADGTAQWKIKDAAGQFRWNTIFRSLSLDSSNNSTVINFPTTLSNPTVLLTKESDCAVDDVHLYIKEKTNTGFTLYSSEFMTKNITTGNFSNTSVCRLIDGELGICYYNIDDDRIEYIYSYASRTKFSTPVIIDDASAVGINCIQLVDGRPAVFYIADDGQEDQWKYARASVSNGALWDTTVVLATSTQDMTFITSAVFVREVDANSVNAKPVVLFNNEFGRAKLMYSNAGVWSSQINVSNLSNHEILDVKIIDDKIAVLARSNTTKCIYYVRSLDDKGSSWPLGATQIYKSAGVPMVSNSGKCCNSLTVIDDVLCIITSECDTNDIYITKSNDATGATWGYCKFICKTNTTSSYPRIFLNNETYYMLYNEYSDRSSKKNLIKFASASDAQNGIVASEELFIDSLSYAADHHILETEGCNSTVVFESDKDLSMLKFFGNDFVVNWMAII